MSDDEVLVDVSYTPHADDLFRVLRERGFNAVDERRRRNEERELRDQKLLRERQQRQRALVAARAERARAAMEARKRSVEPGAPEPPRPNNEPLQPPIVEYVEVYESRNALSGLVVAGNILVSAGVGVALQELVTTLKGWHLRRMEEERGELRSDTKQLSETISHEGSGTGGEISPPSPRSSHTELRITVKGPDGRIVLILEGEQVIDTLEDEPRESGPAE